MDDLKLIRKWKGSEQFTITYACFEFYMAGFWKLHECEHFLVRTLNNWENALDKTESVWALYLISQNDTINHDLLLTKRNAYSFSKTAQILMCCHLKSCKQKVVVGNNVSSTQTIIAGVLEGSIDGTMLFNLLINDYPLSNRRF